ncbi:MAG TPA: hypothetical protein VID26_04445 [Candidatus Limnocylindrales bacterium]
MTYSMYRCWHSGQPIESPAFESVAALFRPQDPEACLWIDPDAPNLLRISFDVEATSEEDAIEQGRSALEPATDSGLLIGQMVEVLALADGYQVAWSRE